jgi:1,2-diacylglycerol 3-alpha-glucosyltransferase
MVELKVALIFINLGPYHFARARALAETEGISPFFIELVGFDDSHPWQVPNKYRSSIKLTTLSNNTRASTDYLHLSGKLIETLDDLDPTIVVTSSYRPLVMLSAARWARSRNKVGVLLFESARSDRPRYRTIEALKRAVIRRYYAAAFVGGDLHRDYLVELGVPPSRIWRPYDVVDNDHFAARSALARVAAAQWRQALGLPEHYFLYVGRYSPEKNLLSLIEAYRLYRAKRAAPWSLVLVGDGPQSIALQTLVSRSRLEGVIFKPFAQYDELPTYYALAECFVLASTSEPWGLVVNEAMACGLPVIVSKLCGCVPELVYEGKNGLCFDPYDLGSMVTALSTLSSLDASARQEMGERSRTIISRFTPRTWAANLSECLRTIGAIDVF